MATDTWSWAELDEEKLELVDEAEATLGADFVLVYASGPGHPATALAGVRPAPLDASGIAYLEGLEQQLGAVAVAYTRS